MSLTRTTLVAGFDRNSIGGSARTPKTAGEARNCGLRISRLGWGGKHMKYVCLEHKQANLSLEADASRMCNSCTSSQALAQSISQVTVSRSRGSASKPCLFDPTQFRRSSAHWGHLPE